MSLAHIADLGLPLPQRELDAAARLEHVFDAGSFRPFRSRVGDGVFAGTGRVHGAPVWGWSQDAGHKGGSLGERGGETIAMTVERANAAGQSVIGFASSGGARLQEGVGALDSYARIFRAQATRRGAQVTVVSGACAGGAAYSPALGDVTVLSGPDARMFLTGPSVVQRVMGEEVDAAALGGPRTHRRNGVADIVVSDDGAALSTARDLLLLLPAAPGRPRPALAARPPAPGDPAAVLPASDRAVYDVRDVTARLVDGGRLLELGARWARNLVCGLATIEGTRVGVIANQPRHLGGAIDSEASQKGARFVRMCDRLGLALVVLVDTPGFIPGLAEERNGVIRHGAALVAAFAAATTPRFTVTTRSAFGGAHITMNSRGLGADLTLAWPGARIGVMGPLPAVEILHRRDIAAGADTAQLAAAYAAEHLPVDVAARRGFVDEVVDPPDTRARLACALTQVAR